MSTEHDPDRPFEAHLHVRLSRPLLRALKRAARKDRRTLSSFVRDRLVEAVGEETAELARIASEDR